MERKCRTCQIVKDINKFYKHPEGKGGYGNRCIACEREYNKAYLAEKRKDPEYVEKQRARSIERYHRLRYGETYKRSKEGRKLARENYQTKYPEKYEALKACNPLRPKDGREMHHWSYKEEHYRDFILLDKKSHNLIHRYMSYDQEHMMYRISKTGELLDNRESHEAFINDIIKTHDES